MKKNIPKTLMLTVLSAVLVSVSSAVTLDFNDLSLDDDVGTLTAGGSNTGLSVSRATSDNNFVYTVTYLGDLGDGDASDDTLTFDVTVEGFSGTSFSGGNTAGQPVAIGTTDADVILTSGFEASPYIWTVGDNDMTSGETLKFSVGNLVVATTAAGTGGSAVSTGFGGTFLNEWRNNGHVGNLSGESIIIQTFNFPNFQDFTLSPALAALYVNSDAAAGNNSDWGVQHVDFGINVTVTAIPEPGAYALIAGYFALTFVMLRPRRL
jgi:hypothetical protein